MGIGLFIIGCCVGSFLNVAIYRIPRGLSVNDPKRSFCPSCQKTLPAWQNIPIFTWIIQAGKCRNCQAPISIRYLIVEALTGMLFFLSWRFLPWVSALLAILFITVLVTISFIDAEYQVIPIRWTSAASILATVGALFQPRLLNLAGDVAMLSAIEGLKWSLIGWLSGFGLLWLVIQFGKLAFGRRKMTFESGEAWKLQEGYGDDPQLHFILGEEAISWDDLFYRESDRLVLSGHGIRLDGKRTKNKELVIERDWIFLDGKKVAIADLDSLEGKAESVVIPREAMGSGDPHLLGMIGSFLGWPGVLFTVGVSSLYGIAGGILGRVGFGRQLPFGPFLALAALTWVFGGWKLWKFYLESLGF